MIYTRNNTSNIGKPVKRVVDANGFEYTHTRRVNTETGEITRLVTDSDDTPHITADHRCVEETIQAAPPIIIEFYRDEDKK